MTSIYLSQSLDIVWHVQLKLLIGKIVCPQNTADFKKR